MLSLKWENSQSTVAWQRASACEISNKHIDISCQALTGPLLLWQTHESPVKHFMEFMKWKGVVSLPTETKMIKVMQFNTAYSVYVRVWFFSVWKPSDQVQWFTGKNSLMCECLIHFVYEPNQAGYPWCMTRLRHHIFTTWIMSFSVAERFHTVMLTDACSCCISQMSLN